MSSFSLLRIFRRNTGSIDRVGDIESYLADALAKSLDELGRGLRTLSFSDNFRGWIERDITIGAGAEVRIVNKIKPDIPTMRIIVKGNSNAVVDGTAAWTTDHVTLKNTSGSSATVSVAFLK